MPRFYCQQYWRCLFQACANLLTSGCSDIDEDCLKTALQVRPIILQLREINWEKKMLRLQISIYSILLCSNFKVSTSHLSYHLTIFFITLRCVASALMDLSWRFREGQRPCCLFFIHVSSLYNILTLNIVWNDLQVSVEFWKYEKQFKMYTLISDLIFLACKTNSEAEPPQKILSCLFYLHFSQLYMWKIMSVRKDDEVVCY